MLVGQNPGGREDLDGRCFVGKSGKVLEAMLRDAGFDPAEVYYTNAVWYRTDRDEKPTHDEIERARTEHLVSEIKRVRPSVIVALGDIPLQSLLKRSGISNLRGSSTLLHADFGYTCEVWPTYHPAFVLRSPTFRNVVVSDLRRIRDRALPKDSVDWKYGNGNDAFDFSSGRVALDIETDYIKGKRGSGDNITQIAFAAPSARHAEVLTEVPKAAAGIRFPITHNGWTFDLPRLKPVLGTLLPLGRDTQVMAYLDDETQPQGLESLCVKYLGVRGWKEDATAPQGSDLFAEYNARDAIYTLRLHDELERRLGPRVAIADKIIGPAYRSLAKCGERGIYVNKTEVLREKEKYEAEKLHYRALASEWVQNPGSNQQVAAALGLAPGSSVSKNVLLGSKHPLASAVLGYRAATKKLSTWIRPYLRAADNGGYVHCTYTLWRTLTGRSSSRKEPIQTLPRTLKKFFGAAPGMVWLSADYSAIEFRIAAWCANEESILARYAANVNWDPHLYFASIFYGRPESDISPLERQIAKSANFSQLYKGNSVTLQNYAKNNGIQLSLYECQKIHEKWHEVFPGFQKWYKEVETELRANGFVETGTGRRRHYGDISLLNRNSFAEAVRQSVNMKVQSLAADIALVALWMLDDPGPCQINYFGHDAIGGQLAPHNLETQKRKMTQKMTVESPAFLKEHFGVDLSNIPLAIEFTEVRN